MKRQIAVLGASGYAGGELIRLVDDHPDMELAYLGAHTKAGATLGAVHPHLRGADRELGPLDPAAVRGVDLAFLALPHGASAEPAMALLARGVKVADLGSDFRLDSVDRYEAAYGAPHPYPAELGKWPYGLPEFFGKHLVGADRAAVPGCYPTSALLALGPLFAEGLLEGGPFVVDSVSGVSGAGRGAKESLMFGAIDEGVAAYGVLTHRHRPEMEQGLAAVGTTEPRVMFTPHLVPMQRGILSTCYAPVAAGVTEMDVSAAFRTWYATTPFVDVVSEPPNTRWIVGTNRALVNPHLDTRTRSVVVVAAIDNLLKGAAGQAVQCANLMLGLDETAGLPTAGWMP
ncbi:MAG: N-acetyl-gamma-glutamyl-phosphate reductase [Acidimicrobiia bacterium]|nr:N-acetyl-gamma-glutamyl-phosphate reductase [Acidimicrobiia bacterium]